MDCVDQVQSKWPDQKIRLTFSDGVRLQDRPLVIPGEETLLKAAITNLIDNACKYSNNNEVNIFLEMNTETSLRLRVKDRGIGIPQNEMLQILEPLQRGSNATSRQGFGIGLTLAQRIIRLHRGGITISSEIDKGTEIVVDFPFPYR